MTVNYVAIRLSGSTITGQASTFYEAAAELRRMLRDPFYNRPPDPIKKLFLSDDKTRRKSRAIERPSDDKS